MTDKISQSQLFSFDNRKKSVKLGAAIMFENLPKLRQLIIIALLILCPQTLAEDATSEEDAELFEMSIEQLMEVEVDTIATLTEANPRLVPAAVTTITDEQIRASGARSLFELLDIYVPNLQWWRNHWEPDNMGLRGILSDRDDKYLLLVNGRVMNERTH